VTTTFSHFGICVSDLERSLRFYCDGLGFTAAESHTVGPEFAALMELEGVALRSQFLRRDGLAIELLYYSSPEAMGPSERRPMNQLGLTHLSVRVDDVDEVAGILESLGGSVVAGTRTTFELGGSVLDFVYCTDPDGVRIELMHLPG
jgi:catechol 2,3-dioxygenase-like lactoylglutathione lyase family enzyme